jgi:hypothetical protein
LPHFVPVGEEGRMYKPILVCVDAAILHCRRRRREEGEGEGEGQRERHDTQQPTTTKIQWH